MMQRFEGARSSQGPANPPPDQGSAQKGHHILMSYSQLESSPSQRTFQHAYCARSPTRELVFAPGGSLADMREEDDSHHQHI